MVKKRCIKGKQPLVMLKAVVISDDEDDLAAVVISDDEDDLGMSSFGMAALPMFILARLCAFMAVPCWMTVTQTSATAKRQFDAVMRLPFSQDNARTQAAALLKEACPGPTSSIPTAEPHVAVGLSAWGFALLKKIGVPGEFFQLLMFMAPRKSAMAVGI